jgi:hypothetical protein
MSKPGADPTSGISLGDVLRLPKRHPACRRHGRSTFNTGHIWRLPAPRLWAKSYRPLPAYSSTEGWALVNIGWKQE